MRLDPTSLFIPKPSKFNVLIEMDEDGYYVATVPSLPGCHTQAKCLDDLIKRAKVAIEVYLEVEK